MSTPSWNNTFNTNHKWWGSMDRAFEGAMKAGYPFISWNGRVFATDSYHSMFEWEKPVCRTEELG